MDGSAPSQSMERRRSVPAYLPKHRGEFGEDVYADEECCCFASFLTTALISVDDSVKDHLKDKKQKLSDHSVEFSG